VHKENNYLLENQIANKVIGIAIDVHRELGLLINFNVSLLKKGIKGIIN